MPSFSKLFKSRDPSSKKNTKPHVNGSIPPAKPQWSDPWERTRVEPEEVVELLSGCTREIKSRALDMPFLLLPFRPTSDPSAARTFVRNYFSPPADREAFRGEYLMRELRLTEPMVLASVMKWCWSRLPGGVVTWEAYELFKVGEIDSQLARDAFATFIPISVDSDARNQIVFDFFDLMAAIAAHGKSNGLGGRKLSRYAGWWAFDHYDTGKGFDAGYSGWTRAASATSHLFFAYLRSLSPDPARGTKGIIGLPIALQQLVQATEYPPEASKLMFNEATKVVMIVGVVSPTPYALLRRAKNFEYRDDGSALQQFTNYDDPVRALTDECRRVLKCISSTNQSTISTTKASTSLRDASWSRFEDVGFGATIEESDGEEDGDGSMLGPVVRHTGGLRTQARSENGDSGRPSTPSWADFLSSGFPDESSQKAASSMLLPPDKILPPIQAMPRGQSSQSHRRNLDAESPLEPGELASIDKLFLDDSFWWVWISSLAGEEPTSRKAVFGRCALIETLLGGGKWMIMEEQVKGAAPEPAPGAYIAEKKGFFGFTTKRGRLTRKRSALNKNTPPHDPYSNPENISPSSRTNIAPDQHARIQAAAAELQRRNGEQDRLTDGARRGRQEEPSNKTNSVMSLQPMVLEEASPAMKWASQYDKNEIRAKYLGNDLAGKGSASDLPLPPTPSGTSAKEPSLSLAERPEDHELPPPPPEKTSPPRSPTPPSSKDVPPSSPLPSSSPQEHPLPETPIPTPPQDNPFIQPPSPPLSDKVAQPPELPPSTKTVESQTTASPEPLITALPKPPSPVASLPGSSEQNSPMSRKAVPSSPEPVNLNKKRNPEKGIKAIFGPRRIKPRDLSTKPRDSSPTEPSPAIAAARAALSGGDKSLPNGQPTHQAVTKASKEIPSPVNGKLHRPGVPSSKPTSQVPDTPPASEMTLVASAAEHPKEAPKRRQDAENESLSRAGTNEREQADREFSSFDQGPLVEQPAFVPPDSPLQPYPDAALQHKELQQQIPGAFMDEVKPEEPEGTNEAKDKEMQETDEAGEAGEPTGLTRQMSPVQDRWAQIRKNAVERATRQSEEQSRQSEVKTDDGETSGEETIESRVARIKARVAELTGNIEAARH